MMMPATTIATTIEPATTQEIIADGTQGL